MSIMSKTDMAVTCSEVSLVMTIMVSKNVKGIWKSRVGEKSKKKVILLFECGY